jgi:MoaA/NifB/PqqE/SkfB family radical SAM enzyme
MAGITHWVPECNFCRNREKNKMHSPRLQSFDRFTALAENNDLLLAEFQIDRECNAACLICGSWNSSTWEKYQSKKEFKIENIDKRIKNDTTQFIEQIKETLDFSQVIRLNFLGGEPLLSDSHLIIIKELEKYKDLKDVRVNYITNGSQRPTDEVVEMWKKCKDVSLTLSIDGTGDHFNYLRWPLQWHQIEDNIKYIMDLDISIHFTCSYTVTPLNIYYHDRYVEWAVNFFANSQVTRVSPDIFFGQPFSANGIMTTAATPPELQEEIKRKYNNFQSFDSNTGHNIDQCLLPFSPVAYKEFMDYITHHDERRKTNWRETFPEIVKYFE